MAISQMLLPEFDQEMANTRKILERVPEDRLDYKPGERSMSLGRLAGHVAELPMWGFMTMSQDGLDLNPGAYKPYAMTTRQELLETFDKNVAASREQIASADDAAFQKNWTLTVMGKPAMPPMPRIAVYRSSFMNHMIHHRGQLTSYLRALNVSFPGLYGPSADDPNPFASTQGS